MKTIGIYLFNNIEVLDFAGPFEVFSTAQRLHAISSDDPSDQLFKVVTIAEQEKPVIARGGLQVMPLHFIEYHPQLDVLIVPGGVVVAERQKAHVISWIRSISERAEVTASVCTGSFLLAEAGLLHGKKATTHWEDVVELRESFPGIDVVSDKRWVDEGDIITSAGMSAGIDMSLYLVRRFAGKEFAEKTARQMDYRFGTS